MRKIIDSLFLLITHSFGFAMAAPRTIFRIVAFIIMMIVATVTQAQEQSALPVNPDVTQDNIDQTICASGYSHSIRPPSQVTNAIKKQLLDEAGIPRWQIHEYVLDHVIPISSGGSPYDIRNLRLEPRDESFEKDRAENRAHSLVCTHRLDLRQAQQLMWSDWRKLLPRGFTENGR